ncbi:hypothetical protein [Paenibacillus sp. KN14-4R]|uniref:hypothetical protein n=1 Tax=Paenibacillus sp. KN14-4R TaxID=3445773 RepID=UPI003F9F9435
MERNKFKKVLRISALALAIVSPALAAQPATVSAAATSPDWSLGNYGIDFINEDQTNGILKDGSFRLSAPYTTGSHNSTVGYKLDGVQYYAPLQIGPPGPSGQPTTVKAWTPVIPLTTNGNHTIEFFVSGGDIGGTKVINISVDSNGSVASLTHN